MDPKPRKERSWIKLFLKLVFLAVLATVVSVPSLTVADYYRHADKYAYYVKLGDSIQGKKELDKLHYFYKLSKEWKVQWWADRYVFGHSFFYEVADAYLINDWNKVLESFKTSQDRLDDPRAYPYANAKVQKARAMYNGGQKKEAIEFVTDEIHKDYEKALRNCLDAGIQYLKCYDRVWNYDITDNKKSGEELLKQPKMPPKFILGPLPLKEDDEGLPRRPNGEEPGGKKLGGTEPGGGERKRP